MRLINIIQEKFINTKTLLFLNILIYIFTGCLNHEVVYDSAPTMLPETDRNMKTAGFWISRYKTPDQIILTEEGINQFNLSIQKQITSVKNITEFGSTYPGEKLRSQLKTIFNEIKKIKLYQSDGKIASEKFYEGIIKNINLNDIPENINVEFGFVIHYTNQRGFPTNDLLNDIPRELFFDSLQFNALDVSTPVAILHESLDEKWFFVSGPISDGWVEKENIVTCSKDYLINYFTTKDYIVITNAKSEIFTNRNLTEYYDYVKMGTKIPLLDKTDTDIFKIKLPNKDENGNFVEKEAFIQKKQANKGYLSYTPRNIIKQAFELLNTPYGWGDMFGEQDCSKFLCEIFATVGIILPRNSSSQAKIGIPVSKFNKETTDDYKIDIIKQNGIPGVTLLRLPGHIMLYLGTYNEKPYVIHSIWAYRENMNLKDNIFLINKVTVSTLSLGKNSKKGSLLTRLNIIANISK